MRGRRSDAVAPNTSLWTRENLAWAGGLFEGEGCFSTTTARGLHFARMRLTSTDRDVIDHFHQIVGCGQVSVGKISPASAARGTSKTPYVWSMSGRLNIYALGVALWEFLGERRRERFAGLVRDTMWRWNAAIARPPEDR